MAIQRTVDLLPEIFRTDTNRKFLSATLDQLTQEPRYNRTRGYVGRRIGPGVDPQDNYVRESTAQRSNYQLEPGVAFLRPDTNQVQDAITYPGMLDALSVLGADVTRQDRLFQSDYYTWDSFCDFDKFTNYSQYYWLPNGPDAVDVAQTQVPLSDDFVVTRNPVSYDFSGVPGINPVIILARGGNYEFRVNQSGHGFWIQSAPGIDGRLPATPNISSRDVLGVSNNGAANGVIRFDVPARTAQDFYYDLVEIDPVDLVSEFQFAQLNNRYVDQFLEQNPNGIDGITNLDSRTVIFVSRETDPVRGGWQINSLFDPLPSGPLNTGQPGSFDSIPYSETQDIISQGARYGIWRINYVPAGSGRFIMRLSLVQQVPVNSKFRIRFGSRYSSTNWFKNPQGFFESIPLLSALQDTLWYQDSTNPEIFGVIKLVDPQGPQLIDIQEIIGSKNYTSPNGVVFTNGLKVQFRGPTNPPQFQDLEYYVEGVGTGPGLDSRVGFVDGEAYFGPWHWYQGHKMTGSVHMDVAHQIIWDTLAQSLENLGASVSQDAPLPRSGSAMVDLGNGIRLVPVRELVTPETYTRGVLTPYDTTPYDFTPFDETLDAPLVKDYITINRSSRDRNAWSRSNRWFHIDVIRYSAEKNNVTPLLDNRSRGNRPIIEFRANLRLYEFGTQGKLPVNIVDFSATDALSDVNGSEGYGVDGYEFLQGTRVIFAADLDKDVRNRVYVVNFIDPDGVESTTPVIHLVPEIDADALADQTVVALNGLTQQGKSFWFDGSSWRLAQQKIGVNQAPLFDVYDDRGRSFADRLFYSSTTFAGTRLFGYAAGNTDIVDRELGFPVRYLNINNVGDIIFQNYFYTDTFQYAKDNVGTEIAVSTGFARQYIDRVSFSELIGWLPAITQNRSRQTFRFSNNSGLLILDVPLDTQSILPAVQIFLDGEFVDPSRYDTQVQGNNTFINLLFDVPQNSILEVNVLSNQASDVGFYQVPSNLENNALNQNSAEFTLGIIRRHYETMGYNLRSLQGPIVGANNTRDLGDISRYGQNIIQNSSPLTLAGVFLREPQYDLAQAIRFNSQEYEKYKARLISAASRGDFVNLSPTQILDACLQELSLTGQESGPFYWSDMIPSGENYTTSRSVYSFISTPTFDLNGVYDFTTSNFQSLLIFVNDRLLVRGLDYTVGDGTPTVTITAPLQIGDVIVIREYPSTYGSFVPNTPTKMGLYPAFLPRMYLDTSYVAPQTVIQGHDGSITVAYGDMRDQVLLEFETRIYNNLKVSGAVPITAADVVPGQWRKTDYDLGEINSILATDFLSWVGWNKIDYTTQTYDSNNAFTFNYSQSQDRINGDTLLGAWRGIYQYFYDTTNPQSRPWEMLGFSQQPSWWESRYGPPPYTSGNLVLWEDLAKGLVKDPQGEYIDPLRQRPGLLQALPVGSEGELLPPTQCVMGNTDALSYRRSWTFGDGGPAESAWRTSSSWPFAVMRLLALTKPAQFFSLFADRDRYRFDTHFAQFLWNGRSRLDARLMSPLYGSGVSRASYINWIIDYNRQLGVDSTRDLQKLLQNLDMRLCWRLGAFSDKRFLKIFTERSTPTSLNTSLLLPDESYQILLYQNPSFASFQYSSVIVQRVPGGWTVFGYSTTQPYFNILTSRPFANVQTISAGNVSVQVSTQHSDTVVRIPYGFVFRNRAAVCDFIISYGALLQRQGMTFEGIENGLVMNWQQMAQEFLYWSSQGWIDGSMINLNPAATGISMVRPGAVAQSLVPVRSDNVILNQNRQAISPDNLIINRLGNSISFAITGAGNDTINYFGLRFTAYEHLVVLDNRSIFADLIYDPVTGARQSRVLVAGVLSADWDGTVNAPGFVLNQDNIRSWSPNQTYTKGEIVRFKDELWTASTIIQPSEEFDYTTWLRSDYDQIQKGLLPNAATSSDQLAEAYAVSKINLEREVDLFSYGLIGFRPRQYMADLDLDDVSQVNLYQQFLGDKGTRRSLELFSLADLGKESAEYDVYEYWAIRRGLYGATANRSYFEVLLDPSRLTSDPNIIEIIQPGQTSQADQTVLIPDIWQSSYVITDTNILPVVTETMNDRALPSAGYVNFDDVDIATFDLDSLLEENINSIENGTIIWTAADGAYNWNVYRAEAVPGRVTRVSDNLDGSSLVNFSDAHNLTRGDVIAIRFFSPDINGVYRIRSVPNIFDVVIDYEFVGFQTSIQAQGIAFNLSTSRVKQASDIAAMQGSADFGVDSLIWVDQSVDGKWMVLEKTQPFRRGEDLLPELSGTESRVGSAVAQGFFNLSALVGAPGYNPNAQISSPGGVVAYARDSSDRYRRSDVLSLPATGTVGYGNAIDIGDQEWAVAGASNSNNQQGYASTIYRSLQSDAFVVEQILTAGDEEFAATRFGESVTISRDERWIGIGAPGDAVSQPGGACYIYARVDVQPQSVSYVTDGVTNRYNYDDHIVVTDFSTSGPVPAWQFLVFLNDVLLRPGVDYIVDSGLVILVSTPVPDLILRMVRRQAAQLDQQQYLDVPAQSLTGSGSGARFDVTVIRGSYIVEISAPGLDYSIGDQLYIPGSQLGGIDSVPPGNVQTGNDLVGNVTAVTNTGVADIGNIIGSGISNTTVFNLGKLFAQIDDIKDFTVVVDDQFQRPYQDYDYVGDDIIFITVPPPGAVIDVTADTHFQYVDKITAPAGFDTGSRFGSSVSTTTDGQAWIIGSPGQPDFIQYPDVQAQALTGSGSGARFDVTVVQGSWSIQITDPGSGYNTADQLYIPGSQLGGIDSVPPGNVQNGNDLVGNVTAVINTGVANFAILQYFDVPVQSVTGSGSGARFDVTVAGGSYSVQVAAPGLGYDIGDQLYIPGSQLGGIDSVPPGNVQNGNDLVGNVTAVTNTGIAEFKIDYGLGSAAIFSRAIEKFLVPIGGQQIFTTHQTLLPPTMVKVNGQYLMDTELNIGGQFTVTSPNTVSISLPLQTGDIVEISTNHIREVQILSPRESQPWWEFGAQVEQCINDCSLYISAPRDSNQAPQAGSVELWQNQARLYGTITSRIANPTLTAGDTISINNVTIAVPDAPNNTVFGLVDAISPKSYDATTQYYPGDRVRYQSQIYLCVLATLGQNPTNINFWALSFAIPNATATVTPDLRLVADGITRRFSIGSVYSDTQFTGSPVTRVLLDGALQTPGSAYVYDNHAQTITFDVTPNKNSIITVVSGRLIISVTDLEASTPFDRISVLPGTGSLWRDLGIPVYVWQQTITSPNPQEFARFGSSISISDDINTLAVGAPGASTIIAMTFDQGETVFDGTTTTIVHAINQSGAVYLYDFLNAYQASVNNPGQFVFGQQVIPANLQPMAEFGTAVDLMTGTSLTGAPNTQDLGLVRPWKAGELYAQGDLVLYQGRAWEALVPGPGGFTNNEFDITQWQMVPAQGLVFQDINVGQGPMWSVKRSETPQVNIDLLNTCYIYDSVSSSAATYLDYFDPLQGRLLGAVAQNINYIGAVDPASYNVGPVNNRGNKWAQDHVGDVWWDTSRVRFVDANQGDLAYSTLRWGQIFPGSVVEIFQWVASDVPPAQYNAAGTPRDEVSYVIVPTVDPQGIFRDIYYFWVTGLIDVDRNRGKTLSIDTLTRYIENPKGSGIPYLAPVSTNTVALYNCGDAINQQDSVLHVEFDKIYNDAAIHAEYQLVAQGRAGSFLDANLYRKFLDSFCGVDSNGAPVPSPLLSPSEKYGISIRPQQSMFVDRFAALENYLTSANLVLAALPMSEIRSSRLLNSSEPEPSANSLLENDRWDIRVINDQELGFQDLDQVPFGYRYLVATDARNRGLWSIYAVVPGEISGSKALQLVRVQNYDTRKYWRRIDWYRAGYDPSTRILLEVPVVADLSALQLPTGSSVKVTSNSRGQWEIYRLDGATWTRVALEAGTIEIDASIWDYQLGRFGFDSEVFDSQYFDQEPVIETRRILEAINQELFIDNLLIERNRLLILMFNYILSEQISPDWLTKTSLIDVDHTIRNLQPFQTYRRDNQDFVLQYINEVKPYHVQIREFGLIYRGIDVCQDSITDFDLPARWDPAERLFVSPVLDDTDTMSTTSSTPSDAPIWQEFPWNQWFQNYLLNIKSVRVVDPGSGYTVPPQVEVTGNSSRPALMTARINSRGQVVAVDVIDPGDSYSGDAVITLTGGNGTGAKAVAVMGNDKVRSITTNIKYDRYQYYSDILPWDPNLVYAAGDRVRYVDRVWQALVPTVAPVSQFELDQWQIIPAGDLTAADRVMGYYTPSASQPGLDLAQLISGIAYPGVQVAAPNFNQNTGFDVGNFDINPFDNLDFDADGVPTYDTQILDTIYQSEFLDPFLGILPAPNYQGDPPTTGPNPIIIDGGQFVDTYSSHAPPELVPASIFDTLDLRVFTTPGANWQGQGRGFLIATKRFQFDASNPVLYYGGLLDYAVYLALYNATTGRRLSPNLDYSISWAEHQVQVFSGANQGDILVIVLASLGGGNQIFSRSYPGDDIEMSLVIPVSIANIFEIVIFRNDEPVSTFTYAPLGPLDTEILFNQQFFDTDVINIIVLGNTPPVMGYSVPNTQFIVADGSQSYVIDGSTMGANPSNAVITVDGVRLRPYAGKRYIADGATSVFALPELSDVVPGTVSANDVSVFVDDVPLILGIDFTVNPWNGLGPRTVTLMMLPMAGSRVVITIRTGSPYRIVGNNLNFLSAVQPVPTVGSIISVTMFNDLDGQDALTTVAVGPTINDTYAVGQPATNGDRLIVTRDGAFLFAGLDYDLVSDSVVLAPGSVALGTVVAITSFTQDTVPQAESFRVFQDMRGRQSLYRILSSNSTELREDLSATADVISVQDATRLDEPNLAQGRFGIITINGERITYRDRNVIDNTVSGLRRGTAGTAANDHMAGSKILGMGPGNLLPTEYQEKIIQQHFLADGIQTVFVAQSLTIDDDDSTELSGAVQVSVAGVLQTSGYAVDSVDPVQISFATPPTAGYQISIYIQQARVMYQQGVMTPSDGVPLQKTQTPAGKFIRGQ